MNIDVCKGSSLIFIPKRPDVERKIHAAEKSVYHEAICKKHAVGFGDTDELSKWLEMA